MKFRYSLQKVVDLKENEKKQAEWLLTSALNKLQREEASLRELKKLQASLQQQMEQAARSSTPIHKLQGMQQYMNYMEQCIENKGQEVRCAKGEVQVKQQGLTAKMLEEKVWLKAKEKAYHFFLDASRKKEQHELDEMATVRFGN